MRSYWSTKKRAILHGLTSTLIDTGWWECPKTISRWITWHPEQQHFGNKRQFANSPDTSRAIGSNRSIWTNGPGFGWYKTPRIKITRNTKVDMYNSNITEPLGNKKTMWQCILILESMEVHVHLMDVWSTRKNNLHRKHLISVLCEMGKWRKIHEFYIPMYPGMDKKWLYLWMKTEVIYLVGHWTSKPNYINAGASHKSIARYPSEQPLLSQPWGWCSPLWIHATVTGWFFSVFFLG